MENPHIGSSLESLFEELGEPLPSSQRGYVGRSLDNLPSLLPGAHVVVLTRDVCLGLTGRRFGLELRDTLLILSTKGVSFALLFRMPCSEPTVAENVLRHGTGALNIDACRVVPTGERLGGGGEKRATFEKSEGWNRPWMRDPIRAALHAKKVLENVEKATQLGRWPSNLVLVHDDRCRRVGTVTVAAPVINRFTDGMKPFGNGAGHAYETVGGGTEDVALYECADGCPVKLLDEQSGDRRSACGGGNQTGVRGGTGIGFGKCEASGYQTMTYHDQGGASRFFPQFEGEKALLVWLGTLIGVDPVDFSCTGTAPGV